MSRCYRGFVFDPCVVADASITSLLVAPRDETVDRRFALTPSTTFAVTPGHAPNAVRLALASPTMDQLDTGLRTLAAMLNAAENDFDSTE